MGLEVLASRSLALIFGSSLQSFAVVLMAFILGIGFGSTAISSPRLQRWQSEKTVVWLLVGAATWIGFLIFRIEAGVDFYRIAHSGLARTSTGYFYHQLITTLFSMLVLGLPAALIGSVLPLLIRTASKASTALGEEVGRLLTWNTLGAVAGVLLTGFCLMPVVGLRGAFGILALALCLVAAVAAVRSQTRPLVLVPVAVAMCLGGVLTFSGEGWRHVMSSGIFRKREAEPDLQFFSFRKQHLKIVFYEDGPDATVSVEHFNVPGGSNDLNLRINGKPDASSTGDLSTQLLVGHLPMLAKPDAKDVFILGMGSGITAGAVLAHPVQRLDVGENCQPVVRAAAWFNRWNRGVLTNPVAHIWPEDARTVLKLSPRQYDVIIMQPSNPWVVGVGSVFSKECYELGAARLKPGGLMVQWFQVYEMHDEIVRLVLRTFSSVFPHIEVWDTSPGDVVLLGAFQPWPSSVEHCRTAWEREGVRQDLGRIGIKSPAALFARQMASQRTGHAMVGAGPIQRDWFPVLEYAAPMAFFLAQNSTVLPAFDERTWQGWLAPTETRRVLEQLSDEDLKPVFREYGSVNGALLARLQERFPQDPIAGSLPKATTVDTTPCVFSPRPPQPYLVPEANEEVKKLWAACALIDAKGDRVAEGIQQVESLVRTRKATSNWQPGRYVALAAKASHALGQADRAHKLIQLGLDQQPDYPELQYLSRVLAGPRTAVAVVQSGER
jgi:spermidine synthase